MVLPVAAVEAVAETAVAAVADAVVEMVTAVAVQVEVEAGEREIQR